MIKVLFFAQLRESLNCAELTVSTEECHSLAQLKTLLTAKGPEWQSAFAQGKVLTAVNQQMTTDDLALNNGDEVAFFPPVTGG